MNSQVENFVWPNSKSGYALESPPIHDSELCSVYDAIIVGHKIRCVVKIVYDTDEFKI